MNISNRYDMPEIYVEAIKQKFYRSSLDRERERKSIAVTTLIDSAYIAHLRKLHSDEMEMDVIDGFFAFRGGLVHGMLEDVSIPNVIKELRLSYPHESGLRIGGIVDLITPKEIIDHKVKSVNSAFYYNAFDMLGNEKQVNIYNYLLGCVLNLSREYLFIDRWYFDWVQGKAANDSSYPQKPHKRVEVAVWELGKTKHFIDERMELHLRTENIPICSPEERWQRPTLYALIKTGNKRATKVYKTPSEVPATIQPGFHIDERKGLDVRCAGYCNVNKWCEYYQSLKNAPEQSLEVENQNSIQSTTETINDILEQT